MRWSRERGEGRVVIAYLAAALIRLGQRLTWAEFWRY